MSANAAAAEAFSDSVARLCASLEDDARALRPALERLDWAMVLPNRAAPGFVYLAGSCRGVAVGGGGADLAEAAGRLAGEASEVLAQAAAAATDAAPCDPALAALWGSGPSMAAANLTRGTVAGVPMASIFPAFDAPEDAPPRSLGLAGGHDMAAARLAGLLELIERDAAARWWTGACRSRALGAEETAEAGAELARLRAGAEGPGRPVSFLALPSVAAPVVVAMSRDAGGRGLVFGLKAALELSRAITGAMRELLQMEIALEIARLRAAQGRLAQGDVGPLARAALDPDAFEAFAPLPPMGDDGSPIAGLDALISDLEARGVEVIVADLAGPEGGLAVAKAFAPGLRPFPGPGDPPPPGAPGAWAALM